MSIGIIGYSFTAVLFFLLGILLLTSWRGRIEGGYLVSAVLVTCLWAVASVFLQLQETRLTVVTYQFFETGRNFAWFLFLFRLLRGLKKAGGSDSRLLKYAPGLLLTASLMLFLLEVLANSHSLNLPQTRIASLQLLGHLGFSVAGLALIEQLFRNTRPEKRWAVKYLYFGIASLFLYDFLLYTDALLFRQVDGELWQARGFVSSILVPLVAIAAARNPHWSIMVFVSRRVVFHATALVGTGAYLLVMSGVGYYIRMYGGSWGKASQMIFLFAALIFLVAVLFSGNLRSKLKVFLSKHFFNYKYDYRDEWLRIIQTLSSGEPGPEIRIRVVKAIADLVESGAGALWMRDEVGKYLCSSNWHSSIPNFTIEEDSSIINFFKHKDWIVDIQELRESPGLYDDLELPGKLADIDVAWLIIPIKQHNDLLGFVVLEKSRAARHINWEDRDLLKTAAQQAGSYLALMQASEALVRANQFEAFNRLSAFVVHDLKNLIAQLELVVKNSERHRNNPEFMDDAIKTVNNAALKMGRLLAQLRKGRFEKSGSKIFSIGDAMQQAISEHAGFQPKPTFQNNTADLKIVTDKDRFTAVIGHLLKNAQEATADDGLVSVRLIKKGDSAEVVIEDNGMGMDHNFIRDKLFQPFETTKGNAGMGVGVYESREFIRSLGGEIEVSSILNEGSTFILRIPLKLSTDQQNIPELTHVEVRL
ncbi:MAG: XrtA/PEP-CTERM system histidine kinase PrsK [Pseudomonadota bacterium]